ncbi:MAG: twin-arginine translocation signal domain-containing protein [Bacteroidota bacterium]
MKEVTAINRRSFLKAGATLGGGLIISFMIPAKGGLKKLLE